MEIDIGVLSPVSSSIISYIDEMTTYINTCKDLK